MIMFLMSCKYLDMFLNKINEMLKKIKFGNNIKLQHLLLGYTIFDTTCIPLNMKGNKLLGMNSLFQNILNKL